MRRRMHRAAPAPVRRRRCRPPRAAAAPRGAAPRAAAVLPGSVPLSYVCASVRSRQRVDAGRGKGSRRRPDGPSRSSSPVSEYHGYPRCARSAAHAAAVVPLRPAGTAPPRSTGYCFRPTDTARRFRPCLRRRFRILRPAFVAMRARKPCLFFRFRLCGRYVGIPMLRLRRVKSWAAKT